MQSCFYFICDKQVKKIKALTCLEQGKHPYQDFSFLLKGKLKISGMLHVTYTVTCNLACHLHSILLYTQESDAQIKVYSS